MIDQTWFCKLLLSDAGIKSPAIYDDLWNFCPIYAITQKEVDSSREIADRRPGNMDKLSHRERLLTILAGDRPDRYAASFWRHFYHMENNAEGTAEAMLHFQREYDWDFMKINPRADYHIEDWGFEQVWSKGEFEKHTKTKFPITRLEDWQKIKPLPPTSPVLAEHLKVVSIIRKRSDKELPILMTVFTPLAIAGRMVEKNEMLAEHLQKAPDVVEGALRAITETFVSFVAELRNAGADGIFFATTQWASSDFVSWAEYQRFGLPYDLKVIRAADVDALNLLHVCHSSNYLTQMTAQPYPATLINWNSFDPTNLPLDRAQAEIPGKRFVGGVDHDGWLLRSTPDEVGCLIDQLKANNTPDRLIIGPGCAIAPEVPKENLHAIRNRL
jgi:uroporphyrinogen decarboxylase